MRGAAVIYREVPFDNEHGRQSSVRLVRCGAVSARHQAALLLERPAGVRRVPTVYRAVHDHGTFVPECHGPCVHTVLCRAYVGISGIHFCPDH